MDLDSDEDVPLAKVLMQISNNETLFRDLKNEETESTEENKNCCEIEKDEINNVTSGHDEKKSALDSLLEYEWPRNRSGEYYVIEEQLIDFLDVDVMDKRLSELEKRLVSAEEEDFLHEIGIRIKLERPNLIRAVKTEDAFQMMADHFPERFQKYIKLTHQKEMKKLVQKQEAQRTDVISGNIPNFMKRALKETVRYNSQLNQERMEERQAYFDLQTQIIHLPQKKRKYNPLNKSQRSEYPVALMPGQYQDYFKRFTANELNQFPLNTVTSKSVNMKKLKAVIEEKIEEAPLVEDALKDKEEEEKDEVIEKEAEAKSEKDPFCGICMKGPEMNKRGLPEKLIHCSQCENSGHPSCLDMNRHLVQVIQTYPWQCMECKICTECLGPHDEEAMMFCDNCDRGYHSYCVGLKEIPNGRWVCDRCGKCSSCLITQPVPEGMTGRWKNEFSKPLDGSEAEFLQIHCHACSKLFRKGSFCPACLKVYHTDDDHINPMVCCDVCDRWIHADCDSIDEHRYMELSKDQHASYTCIVCRGEKEERIDSFHRKNR